MKFSEYYGLNKNQAELDFVDIPLERDIPLFIDPYAAATKADAWSTECARAINTFFQAVLDRIRSDDHNDALRLLDGLHEPNETHLGLSNKKLSGRGIGADQAQDIYKMLAESEAVRTGLISDLSDCGLMIEHIGPDKISDITTNVIRRQLISYTQAQCELHGIPLRNDVASGPLWNFVAENWEQEYTKLPVIDGGKILLVPKFSVRRSMSVEHQDYYNHHVIDFLVMEEYRTNSSLVQALKSGDPRVYKKDVKDKYPISKRFIVEFTREHPDVLEEYKREKAATGAADNVDIDENFDESIFANTLIAGLDRINSGSDEANIYHSYMIGVLSFIFYPNLIYPVKENEIHHGRKRIDITYTNAAQSGLFNRFSAVTRKPCPHVVVECKNYSRDIANPELDQIAGRFGHRGWLGILVCRHIQNKSLFIERCRDTAIDGRGYILPLDDQDIKKMLNLIKDGFRDQIDQYLSNRFDKLLR